MRATDSTDKAQTQPIYISPEAHRAMAAKVREWTGWPKAMLKFDKPPARVSPYAMCDRDKQTITADPEHLILNPNRVLLTVTPFRLRQEAVLTGTLLHESGHARHSLWMMSGVQPLHSDGTTPTAQALSLAKVMEEPRVEGLMALNAATIGALGLGWTMRAAAAHLLPMTQVAADPAQAIMDLLTSWALRAGRQIALGERSRSSLNKTNEIYNPPRWVAQFTSLLHQNIEAHLEARVEAGAVLKVADSNGNMHEETANYRSQRIVALLRDMIACDDDTGPTMIDSARDVLALLFPETPDDDDSDASDDEAMAGDPHEQGEQGEGDPSEPDEGAGEGEGQPEADEPGDQPGEPDAGGSDSTDTEPDSDKEADTESGDGAGASDSTGDDAQSALAKALAEMEAKAQAQTEAEAQDQAEQAPPMDAGAASGAGLGSGNSRGGSWRAPDSDDRDIAKGAEHFLRNMLDASETSKRSLTDQPSALVDGARLAEWKAGGQQREPHFFVRNRRNVEPSPPIKIAILVDVSASMDVLQKPSALLSWALSNAALDLRNFAGRGQQIESCLIHWGDDVEVMQAPGQVLPSIREVWCNQGTTNMHGAIDMVEEVIPDFFDITDRPVNRLLVQFTDWQLFYAREAGERVARTLEAGVNMLSVVPSNYSYRTTSLDQVLRMAPIQRGTSTVVKYNPANPGAVWTQAAEMLSGRAPDAAAQYGF